MLKCKKCQQNLDSKWTQVKKTWYFTILLLFSARNTTSLFDRCMTKAIYVIDYISGKIIYNSALVVQGKTILFHLLKLNTQNVNIHTN